MTLTAEAFSTAIAGIDYAPRGMWFSELFLFLSTCATAGVTLLVESGVRHGTSTRVLAAVGLAPIIAIDLKHFEVGPVAGVRFITGDAREVVPRLLRQHRDQRIGVLLDGPKGPKGLQLKDVCLHAPNVEVVGCHDVAAGHGETWHSHAPSMRLLARGFDTRIPAAVLLADPLGPGLGVWVSP